MMRAFGLCFYLIIGYLVAAWLTDTVFMEMSLTQWNSLWTYVSIGLWPFVLIGHFTFYAVIITILVAAGFFLKEKVFG